MIVHIGLGKTGTTSLQRAIFPRLVEEGFLEQYNPPHIMRALWHYVFTGNGAEQLKSDLSALPEKTLISLESLAGWNPATWADNAIKNALIFPETSTVIITIRDTRSYLTSAYVQLLQQGSVLRPHEFFLSDSQYDTLAHLARPYLCEVFKVDDFNYKDLVRLYSDRFPKVVVVPFLNLPKLQFLDHIELVPENYLEIFCDLFSRSKRENISYSKRSVRLTYVREDFLSKFGLKTKSSHDFIFENFRGYFGKPVTPWDVRNEGFLKKSWSRLLAFLSWRYLMQNVVDRFFSYEKYELPEDVSLGKSFDENERFYQEVIDTDRGFLSIER